MVKKEKKVLDPPDYPDPLQNLKRVLSSNPSVKFHVNQMSSFQSNPEDSHTAVKTSLADELSHTLKCTVKFMSLSLSKLHSKKNTAISPRRALPCFSSSLLNQDITIMQHVREHDDAVHEKAAVSEPGHVHPSCQSLATTLNPFLKSY